VSDIPDLTDSERLALQSVVRFDEKVQDLRDAEAGLHEAVGRVHAATADLGRTVKDARDAVKQLAREEVRKYLAKESERIAQTIREDIKRGRRVE
jgi:hypothetical protein